MAHVQLDRAAVAWREVEGEFVIIDLRNSEYFTVNEAAAHIWPLLGDGAHEDDLVAALVAEYGICAEQARGDLAVMLAELQRRGMVLFGAGPRQ